MSVQPTSILKKLAALVAAAVTATLLVAVGPASAASTVTITNAGDLAINGTSDRGHVLILADGDYIDVDTTFGSVSVGARFHRNELRRDIVVNMRGGGGYIGVIEVDVPRDLKINMGSGVNQIVYEGVHVGRNVNVIDGSGEVDFSVSHSTVLGRANFSAGAGPSYFEFRENHWAGNFAYRIAASGSFSGSLHNETFVRPVRITGGNNTDKLRISGQSAKFGTSTTIDLRGGNDELSSENLVHYGRTTIRGGSGLDLISIVDAVMETTYTIDMGSGDDITYMQSVISRGRATVNGGAGGDLLGVVNPYGNDLRVRSVEGGYGY